MILLLLLASPKRLCEGTVAIVLNPVYSPFNGDVDVNLEEDDQCMATSSDFRDYYKKITNEELLSILNNPGDYQSFALEAAKKEFSERRLSETDIIEARQLLVDKQMQKQKQKEKIKAFENKIKAGGHALIDTLNPIQPGIPSTEKTIRWIVIVMGGLFLYEFISDFKLHVSYAKDIFRFPMDSILYLAPLVLLPTAIFTIWKRFRIGWTHLVIYLVFSLGALLWLLIHTLLWRSSDSPTDSFFPQPHSSTLVIQLLFLGGLLYVVCRQAIRNEFAVSENKMIGTILVSGIVSFFVFYANS